MHWWRNQSTNTSAPFGEQYTAHRAQPRWAQPRWLPNIILSCRLPSCDFYSDYHFDTLQVYGEYYSPFLLVRSFFYDSNFESVFLFDMPNAHLHKSRNTQVWQVVSFGCVLLLFLTCVDVVFDWDFLCSLHNRCRRSNVGYTCSRAWWIWIKFWKQPSPRLRSVNTISLIERSRDVLGVRNFTNTYLYNTTQNPPKKRPCRLIP